jgi:hypothetical protein
VSSAHTDVAAYAIGALDFADAEQFEVHLRSCLTCPSELSWLSQVSRLMSKVNPTRLVEDVR